MSDKVPGKVGQPPGPRKMTAEVVHTICGCISQGVPAKVACAAAGINARTYYKWMELAETEEEGPYRDFADAIERAKAGGTVTLVRSIHDTAMDNWRAAAWLLERREPEHFAAKQDHQVSVNHSLAVKPFNRKSADRIRIAMGADPQAVRDNNDKDKLDKGNWGLD